MDRDKVLESARKVLRVESDSIEAVYARLGDEFINIPLKKNMASLNVAVAFGVIAFEVQKKTKEL